MYIEPLVMRRQEPLNSTSQRSPYRNVTFMPIAPRTHAHAVTDLLALVVILDTLPAQSSFSERRTSFARLIHDLDGRLYELRHRKHCFAGVDENIYEGRRDIGRYPACERFHSGRFVRYFSRVERDLCLF